MDILCVYLGDRRRDDLYGDIPDRTAPVVLTVGFYGARHKGFILHGILAEISIEHKKLRFRLVGNRAALLADEFAVCILLRHTAAARTYIIREIRSKAAFLLQLLHGRQRSVCVLIGDRLLLLRLGNLRLLRGDLRVDIRQQACKVLAGCGILLKPLRNCRNIRRLQRLQPGQLSVKPEQNGLLRQRICRVDRLLHRE